MEVVKNQIDDVNAVITVKIKKEDINPNVEKTLKDYQKKAQVPGFRPGKVPMGMINKMYRNPVLIDELNKAVSESIYNYIETEKIRLLGEPLPGKDQKQLDIDTQDEFEFIFDIATSPEIDVNLTKREKVTEYSAIIDDDLKQKHIDNIQRKFGNFIDIDVVKDNSVVKGEIFQIDKDGNVLENGVRVDETSIDVNYIVDEKTKKEFIGAEINKTIDLDIFKAFENETEISSMLNIKKEELAGLSPEFRFTLSSIREFVKAEVNQELFDKAFGEASVSSKEEFDAKVEEMISENFKTETDYLLAYDIKEKLIAKFDQNLPEEFLKRWLKATNKELTDEQIEKDFHLFLKDLKWTLIKTNIVEKNDIKVDESDIREAIKSNVRMQLQKYGINQIPDEDLEKFGEEMFKKEEERKKAFEQKLDEKVIGFAKDSIKIETKELTLPEIEDIFKERFKQ
jgi:trigger factor